MFKSHAAGGESIEIGSLDGRVAIAVHTVAQVIGNDQQYIQLFRRMNRCRYRQQQNEGTE